MEIYAELKNGFISNKAVFRDYHPLPTDWIDVTGIVCAIGDPVVNGVPIPRPSPCHSLSGKNWVITEASAAKKLSKEAEIERYKNIGSAIEGAGIRKLSIDIAHRKVDNIFAGAITVPLLRAACVKAFKLLIINLLK